MGPHAAEDSVPVLGCLQALISSLPDLLLTTETQVHRTARLQGQETHCDLSLSPAADSWRSQETSHSYGTTGNWP